MYVHHFLKKVQEEGNQQDEIQQKPGYFGYVKNYVFSFSPKPFYYNIGGDNYSLEELKHGLLRNNIKAPLFYMRSLGSNDQRLNLLRNHWDPRINFVCLDYPTFLEHIDPLDGSSAEALDEDLDKFVSEIVNAKVNIDTDQGSITLPQVMDDYRADFGGSDDKLLEFIFHYLEEEYDLETIL
jgi:hypothetical protein